MTSMAVSAKCRQHRVSTLDVWRGSHHGTTALFHDHEDSSRPERTAGMWLVLELATNGDHEAMGLCALTTSLRKPNGRRHSIWTVMIDCAQKLSVWLVHVTVCDRHAGVTRWQQINSIQTLTIEFKVLITELVELYGSACKAVCKWPCKVFANACSVPACLCNPLCTMSPLNTWFNIWQRKLSSQKPNAVSLWSAISSLPEWPWHHSATRQSGFDLPQQQWSLLNRFCMEQGHCSTSRRKWWLTYTDLGVLAVRPRRCPTLSNPVLWQSWLVAYPSYTLRMKTLFPGW